MSLFRKQLIIKLDKAEEFAACRVCLVCGVVHDVAPVPRHFSHTHVIDRTSKLVKVLNVFGALLIIAGLGGLMARNCSYQTNKTYIAVPLCGSCRAKLDAEDNKGAKLSKLVDYLIISTLGCFLGIPAILVLLFIISKTELYHHELFRQSLGYLGYALCVGAVVSIITELLLILYIKKRTLIKVGDIGEGRIIFKVRHRVLERMGTI